MERLLYELRPWIFLLISIYALSHGADSKIMSASGWLLMGATLTILYARFINRKL